MKEVSPLNDFVISADRDEKVRVSCYPNAYVIQSYCLGHSQFVTKIHTPAYSSTENPILVSGGGEGLVNLWNIKTGKQLSTIDIKKVAEEEFKTPFESAAIHAIASCPTNKAVVAIAEA